VACHEPTAEPLPDDFNSALFYLSDKKSYNPTGFRWLFHPGVPLVWGVSQQHERIQVVKRYGAVIGLREERIEHYRRLHASVWDGVLAMIRQCHIHNYSIYLRRLPDGQYYLFSYFEYTGQDFEADLAKMAADPVTQEWWKVCMPCQIPFEDRSNGEWWAGMEEVFHLD